VPSPHTSEDGNQRGDPGQEGGEPVAILTSKAPGVDERGTSGVRQLFFTSSFQNLKIRTHSLIFDRVQRPLSEHIVRLEERIVLLKRELRNQNLADYERSEREISLMNAEEALKVFLRAHDLEQKKL
jgi:hypothetical protein